VRNRHVEPRRDPVREVELQPFRLARRQRRDDDEVVLLVLKAIADGEERVLIADLARDLDAGCSKTREQLIEPLLRLLVRLALGPVVRSVRTGCRRNHDVETARLCARTRGHFVEETRLGKRLVGDDEIRLHDNLPAARGFARA